MRCTVTLNVHFQTRFTLEHSKKQTGKENENKTNPKQKKF